MIALLLTLGAAGCGGGGGSGVETTTPSGGEGPDNEAPLLPMRAGLRLSSGRGVLWEVVRVTDDGVAVTSDGRFARSRYGWGRLDPLIYRSGAVSAREFSEVLDGVVLDVPDTVRVGMTWRSGPFEFAVTAREEGVATRLGPRTVWTIERSGVPVRYVEGVGPWLDDLASAVVPLEDAPPLPAIAPTPIAGPAIMDLEGPVADLQVYEREDGLTLTLATNPVTCVALRVRDGQWVLSDLPKVDHNDTPGDPRAPLMNTCHVLGAGSSGFDAPWAASHELWMAQSSYELYRGMTAADGGEHLFGVPGEDEPHSLHGDWGTWTSLGRRQSLDEIVTYADGLSLTAIRFAPWIIRPGYSVRTAGTLDDDGTLPILFVDTDGRAATATLDHPRARLGRAALAPPAPGVVTIRVHRGGHDRLVATAEGAILARGEDGGFSRIATVEVPPTHTIVGAARVGALDPTGLLIVTRSVNPREPGDRASERLRSHLFRAELGVEAPEPMAPASAAVASAAGEDALVCWPPTDAPLDPTGWVLAGRPAAAVMAVPDEPGCALVDRDLTAIDVEEALVVEGPIPGIGRALLTVDPAAHEAVFGASASRAVFSDRVVTDALGLPVRYRSTRGDPVPDATGAGAWVPVLRDDAWGAALERADGSVIEALDAPPGMPVAAGVRIVADLADGGVLLRYLDGSIEAPIVARPDGTTLSVRFPPSYSIGNPFCALRDGRLCVLHRDGVRCAPPDGPEALIPAEWPDGVPPSRCTEIADGALLGWSPTFHVIVDVDGGVASVGPDRLLSPRRIGGVLASPLLEGGWVQVSPTGLEPLEIPDVPTELGPIQDLAATDEVWVVSLATRTLRIPR